MPQSKKIVAQSGMQQFEGITGDAIDLGILRRSRLMDRAITSLTEQSFPASVVDEKLKMLDAASAPYITVKSENFIIYGDWQPEVLQQAAAWAERAFAFCKIAYEGYEGFPPGSQPVRKMVFLQDREIWNALVRENARGDVEFIIKNASATQLKGCHVATVEQVRNAAASRTDVDLTRTVDEVLG